MMHRPRRFARLACTSVLFLLIVQPTPARGQDVDASELSLEALMRVTVEPVFGASLRLQPMTEAPASVTIVTADDIARHGYETLADILADVRGFYVTNDRNYSYLGARGFALPGDYNTRILLLVDGHRINDAIFEQATFGHDLAFDVRSFERVEVIRGPASALYGTSAFFAVVNVVTRSGRAIDGVEASVRSGSLGTQVGRISAGRAFSPDLDVAVTGTVGRQLGPSRLYFAEFDAPETNFGVVGRLDDEDYRQVTGRVTWRQLQVSAGASSRDKQVPTASFGTIFGDSRLVTNDARAFAQVRYDRPFGRSRVSGQVSLDRYWYDGVYPEWTDGPGSSSVLLDDFAEGRWWTGDLRLTHALPADHTFTTGLDFRQTFREQQGGGYRDDEDSRFLYDNTSRMVGLYAQDEWAVTRHFLVTAGLRYDRYAGFDRVTPRFAAVAKTSDDQAFKYIYGSAFRAPNAYETDYYSEVRRLDLMPERVVSHEVVWERYTGRWLRTTASVYVNQLEDLIGFLGVDTDTFRFENVGSVNSRGIELEAEVRHRSGIRSQVSYARQRAIDRTTDTTMMNSPAHMLKVQTSATGPRQSTVAVSVQYLGQRKALDGSTVDPVALTHVTATLPVRRGLRLVATARNLFDVAYGDPGSAEHLQRVIPQNGRTVVVGLEWHGGR